MNFFLALVVAISAWITFSSLNELAAAHDGKGCCESKDCGASRINEMLWWMNLLIAIVFTIYVLMQVYDMYGGGLMGKASSMLRKNKVTEGVQMVFGN